MQISYENKIVVITGAAGGLGAEMARRFAADGAAVAVCDLKNTEAVTEEIKAAGGKAHGFHFDVTNREQTSSVMKMISRRYGSVDVLINNAGINVGPEQRKTIDAFDDKWWDAIQRVDLDGVYNCSKSVIPYMNKNNGAIVNVSSIVGLVPLRNQCSFAAAKAGVINLSKAMAIELAQKHIRVNVLAPGTIGLELTNQLWQKDDALQRLIAHIPMGRQGTPADVAQAAMFLASDAAAYITGVVVPVDGGWTAGGFARDF